MKINPRKKINTFKHDWIQMYEENYSVLKREVNYKCLKDSIFP